MISSRVWACIAVTATFVINIVGFTTPYWKYVSDESGEAYFGLWQACERGTSGPVTCFSIVENGEAADWFKAVQGLTTAGFIFITLGYIVMFGSFFKKDDKRVKMQRCSIAMLLLAGILILVAILTFGMEDANAGMKRMTKVGYLHFSYVLTITSIGGTVLSSLLIKWDSDHIDSSYQSF